MEVLPLHSSTVDESVESNMSRVFPKNPQNQCAFEHFLFTIPVFLRTKCTQGMIS